jgi:putative ABC transport system permease protein
MSFFMLVFKSAFRNRLRSILTSVGVAIAIIAFLFLRTFIAEWGRGADAAAADRLVVRNKISIIFPLPMSYYTKVKNTPGVTDATYANWFGGVYKDERNFFAQFAVDAETYMKVYPEILIPEDQRQAWLNDRTGCVIGEDLAAKYNWKIGDQIPIQGTIYPGDWKFTVRAIYKSSNKAIDTKSMAFHWKYLDEAMPDARKNQLGIIILRVADPGRGTQVGQSIDQMFQNSLAETRTESEKAFQLAFLSMVSTILLAISVISLVVLVILMLILGNTMAMATRERTVEYAVLRAIGFRPGHVVTMVIGEGLVIAAVGVLLGVAMAPPIMKFFAQQFEKSLGSFFSVFELDPKLVGIATGVALLLGMVAAGIPAWRAGRMKLVDALRRVE